MASTRLYVRGTLANLVRGIAPAVVNGLLPIVLVGVLARDTFSSWSLAMSLTAYVAVFQVGVYQAVTAVAAPSRRGRPRPTLGLPLAAALEFLAPLMAVAAGLAIAVAVFAASVFPKMPAPLLGQFRVALLLLTAAAIATQLSAAGWGFAVGIDRIGPSTIAWLLGRFVSFAAAAALAVTTHDIAWVSLGFAAPIIASLPWQLTSVDLHWHDFSPRFRHARRWYRIRYLRAARTLAALGLAMLMVAGLDGVLVGHFDFVHAGVFVFVAALVSLFVGVIGAWTASYLAHAPVLGAAGVRSAIATAGRLSMTTNLLLAGLSALPVWILLRALFDRSDAQVGYIIFVLLICANAFRQWAMPPVLSAVAGERYSRLVVTGLAEGGCNLVFSVLFGAWLGAVGVAAGTVVGVVFAVPVVLGYTFRDEHWVPLDVRGFALATLVRPVGVLALPVGALLAVPFFVPSQPAAAALQVVCAALAAAAGWRGCLLPAERAAITSRLRRARTTPAVAEPAPRLPARRRDEELVG